MRLHHLVALSTLIGAGPAGCGDDTASTSSATGAGAGGAASSSASSSTAASTVSSGGEAGAPGDGGGGAGGSGGGPATFELRVVVEGLEGALTVERGDDELTVDQDGSYPFDTELEDGEAFTVVVTSEPGLARCAADSPSGEIDGADAEVTVRCDRQLVFQANDGVGPQLWKTDGTVEGTVALTAFDAAFELDAGGGGPIGGVRLPDGVLVLSAETAVPGRGLWRTDGTPEGTFAIEDVDAAYRSSQPGSLALFRGEAWLGGSARGTSGLVVSDGTPEGTRLAVDLASGAPRLLGATDDALVFLADLGGTLFQVFATDGTQEGTVAVTEALRPAAIDFTSAVLDGRVYFRWDSEGSPNELWASDGTIAGTGRVAAFDDGPNPRMSGLRSGAGTVFMQALFVGAPGYQPWVSDGTEEGTVLLHACGDPSQFEAFGDLVGFSATPPGGGSPRQLFLSDGTPEGTEIFEGLHQATGSVHSLNTAGSLLFYVGRPSAGVQALYATDGTIEGTHSVLEPAALSGDIGLGQALAALVFLVDDPDIGTEPWVSHGTPEGTHLLADTCPGACSATDEP